MSKTKVKDREIKLSDIQDRLGRRMAMLSKEVKDNTDKGMYFSAAGFSAIRDGVEIALEDIKRIAR